MSKKSKKQVKKQVKKSNGTGYRVAVAGATGIVKILLLVLCIIAIAALGRKAYTFGYAVAEGAAYEEEPGNSVVVTIEDGSSAHEIGKELRNSGVIADAWVFTVQERLSEYHDMLKGGTYRLNSSMTPEEIMAVLAGDVEEEEEDAAASDSSSATTSDSTSDSTASDSSAATDSTSDTVTDGSADSTTQEALPTESEATDAKMKD